MNKFNLPYGLHIASNDPVDSRLVCADEKSRYALVESGRAYMGLMVFQLDSKEYFKLMGSTNADWVNFEISLTDSFSEDSSLIAASAKAMKMLYEKVTRLESRITQIEGNT
ncbi:hypothetical protein [Persicobacter sp. CCB-QB2]|uniref:hypothetical protein n=1 Tax=Persicobacter sp. CCB-QB2 TaxID=1561025 RepID=UPI0006A9E7C9|nr:hypothetical protein [Persicobacter sp. CCB-QB2]